MLYIYTLYTNIFMQGDELKQKKNERTAVSFKLFVRDKAKQETQG